MPHKDEPKEPIEAWQFYQGLQEFLAEFEKLRELFRDAKGHILTNVKAFPPSELECLVRDGVLSSDEVPEELRTDVVKKRLCPAHTDHMRRGRT